MKTFIFAIIAIVLLAPPVVWSQTATRMTDDQLKKVWETVDQSAGKFRDAVGSKLQKITTASGEYDIQQILKDFDSSAEKLRNAFSDHNESMSDVEAFLRQAAKIDTGMKNHPDLTNANSEWQTVRGNVDQLVKAYRVSWDWTDNAPHPSRMHDVELGGLVTRIKELSDKLRDPVKDSMKTADKSARESVEKAFKTQKKQAEELSNRIKDNKPVSSEVDQLLATGTSIRESLKSVQLNNKASSSWMTMQGLLSSLAREYGLPAPAAS